MVGRLVCRVWFLMQKMVVLKSFVQVRMLPDNFTKVSSDDDIDIGRKLDVGVEVLRNIKGDTSSLVIEMREHNKEQRGHNTRLEAILEKLAEK